MKKRRILLLVITAITPLLFLFRWGKVVSAETSDEELLVLYDKLDYILNLNDGLFYMNIIRWIGWGLIKALSWINNFIEDAVYSIVGARGFYQSEAMNDIMDVVVPIAFGLFVIALVVLGFQFMMNKIEKREEIFLNVLMACAVILLIPILVTNMHKVLSFGVDELDGLSPTLSGNVIQSNVADLKYYMDKEFVMDETGAGNDDLPPLPQSRTDSSVGTTEFSYANLLSKANPDIEITETIDIQEDEGWFSWTTEEWVKRLKDDNRVAYDFMLHKRLPTGNSNQYGVVDLNKNNVPGTSIGREAYYRYHVNWGTVIFTLAVTGFVLAITVVKVGRMMFDIVFTQFFALFVAVTDLTGGQRTKKVLLELANSFGVLFVMLFILQLFIYYANWVNSLRADIGFIPVILMLIAGAWAVIDAPDIVQRMMGIDAGLRSGYGALVGAAAAVSLAGKGGKMGKNIATGALTKGAGMAGLIRGGLGGLRSRQTSSPIPNKQGKQNFMQDGKQKNQDQRNTDNLKERQQANNMQDMHGQQNLTQQQQTQQQQGRFSSQEEMGKENNLSNQIPSPDTNNSTQQQQGSYDSKVGKGESKKIPSIPTTQKTNEAQGKKSQQQQQNWIISQDGKGNQQTIPKGYTETSSGLIVPDNKKDSQQIPSTQQSDIQSSTFNPSTQMTKNNMDKGTNISNQIPTMDTKESTQYQQTQQQQGYISQDKNGNNLSQTIPTMSDVSLPQQQVQERRIPKRGGIITGSRMFARMEQSFNRGKESGEFLGQGVRKASKPIVKSINKGAGGLSKQIGLSKKMNIKELGKKDDR